MPTDLAKLTQCLAAMKATYLADPDGSVRSQAFIQHLHAFCAEELRTHGVDEGKVQIILEAKLYGSHKQKDVDLAVVHPVNGPQIMIGLRSQMSSVGKNLLTYYEEIIGDVISLHDRFPMAVINYVYLLPRHAIKPGLKEAVDLRRAAQLFKMITERPDWRGPKDQYEHFAFLPVDFETDPPMLLDPETDLQVEGGRALSVADFFDKILKTYRERNLFLEIA
ncbi:MAG: hypothetical protein ACM3VX_06100 [Bacteroidota bacterium]